MLLENEFFNSIDKCLFVKINLTLLFLKLKYVNEG